VPKHIKHEHNQKKRKRKNKTKAPLNSTAKQQEVPPLTATPRLEKMVLL
jgi:hypothetical protein